MQNGVFIREKSSGETLMKIITSITSQPRQQFILRLDNNESVTINLYYYSSQSSWYFDIEYKDYVNRGNKVVLTMNALRHLKNKLPFGIAIISGSYADPFQLDDFSTKNVLMLLLNAEEVQEIEETIYNAQ